MSSESKDKAEKDLVRALANVHCLHAEVGMCLRVSIFTLHALGLGLDLHATAIWSETGCVTEVA